MSEQEKKQQRIYDLFNAETKSKNISAIIGVSLWPPSSPNLNPLDNVIYIFTNPSTQAGYDTRSIF